MKKDKSAYRILVLSDLKNFSDTTMKSTVSLAKMINGQIDFFHVKNASDIVERENQLSANRKINEEQNRTNNKIQKLINPICKEYGVKINYNFSFGNVKNEIEKHLKEKQPDIIVLGKRKSKIFSFIGDGVTNHVLKKHKGVVMISANSNALEPNTSISIGAINGSEHKLNIGFTDNLIANTQEPMKFFKIIKNSGKLSDTTSSFDDNKVEYVFEQGDNTIKNLSKYLSQNNINLLCVDRVRKGSKNKANLKESDINAVINKLNVSLLIAGK